VGIIVMCSFPEERLQYRRFRELRNNWHW